MKSNTTGFGGNIKSNMTGVGYYDIKYDRGWDIMKSNMTEFGSIMTSNMTGVGYCEVKYNRGWGHCEVTLA